MPGTPSSAIQAAPGAVGQNHGLGHDQVQRRAALAHRDLHLFGAVRLGTIVAVEAEVVIRPVEGLGLATHHLARRFQVAGQPVEERELLTPPGGVDRCCGRRGPVRFMRRVLAARPR
jgi:hypothetical protein